jgi:hypothetical protein
MNTFNKKETMSPCLIQQLFRQKIGVELDQSLFEEVLFPLLRKEKHLPRELLLDIKFTQSCKENGESAIVNFTFKHLEGIMKNSSPFTPILALGRLNHPIATKMLHEGKVTSKYRRNMASYRNWGSIEILNELRELNHPQIGYHNSQGAMVLLEYPNDPYVEEEDLEYVYIRLEECRHWSAYYTEEEKHKLAIDSEIVNDFLQNTLVIGKRLSWGGNPKYMFEPILSTEH